MTGFPCCSFVMCTPSQSTFAVTLKVGEEYPRCRVAAWLLPWYYEATQQLGNSENSNLPVYYGTLARLINMVRIWYFPRDRSILDCCNNMVCKVSRDRNMGRAGEFHYQSPCFPSPKIISVVGLRGDRAKEKIIFYCARGAQALNKN